MSLEIVKQLEAQITPENPEDNFAVIQRDLMSLVERLQMQDKALLCGFMGDEYFVLLEDKKSPATEVSDLVSSCKAAYNFALFLSKQKIGSDINGSEDDREQLLQSGGRLLSGQKRIVITDKYQLAYAEVLLKLLYWTKIWKDAVPGFVVGPAVRARIKAEIDIEKTIANLAQEIINKRAKVLAEANFSQASTDKIIAVTDAKPVGGEISKRIESEVTVNELRIDERQLLDVATTQTAMATLDEHIEALKGVVTKSQLTTDDIAFISNKIKLIRDELLPDLEKIKIFFSEQVAIKLSELQEITKAQEELKKLTEIKELCEKAHADKLLPAYNPEWIEIIHLSNDDKNLWMGLTEHGSLAYKLKNSERMFSKKKTLRPTQKQQELKDKIDSAVSAEIDNLKNELGEDVERRVETLRNELTNLNKEYSKVGEKINAAMQCMQVAKENLPKLRVEENLQQLIQEMQAVSQDQDGPQVADAAASVKITRLQAITQALLGALESIRSAFASLLKYLAGLSHPKDEIREPSTKRQKTDSDENDKGVTSSLSLRNSMN